MQHRSELQAGVLASSHHIITITRISGKALKYFGTTITIAIDLFVTSLTPQMRGLCKYRQL